MTKLVVLDDFQLEDYNGEVYTIDAEDLPIDLIDLMADLDIYPENRIIYNTKTGKLEEVNLVYTKKVTRFPKGVIDKFEFGDDTLIAVVD